MPTHQSIGGGSDEDLLQRMVATHAERFGEAFWALFDAHVAPAMPERPVVIDLGCGPGLLLRDLGQRFPRADLYGYDVTPAMIAYGQALAGPGVKPKVALLDVATAPLPHAAGSAHLVAMSSVLHVVDEPLPVLAEIRRVLAPRGVFLLLDWVRRPLADYLAYRRDTMGDGEPESQARGFRLFPVHNKYTPDDWRWLLARAGLAIRHATPFRSTHHIFVAARAEANASPADGARGAPEAHR